MFVKACWLLCQRKISVSELTDGDNLILEFCVVCTQLYGPTICTMNMHLHAHIKECIDDYGPIYSFWCFSFERLNGILGSYHTNCHNISVQLTRRFLETKLYYAPDNWPSEFAQEYLSLLKRFDYNKGSLMQTSINQDQGTNSSVSVHSLLPGSECAFSPFELCNK